MATEEEIRALLRERCDQAGSAKAWASANGMAFSYVSEVLRGEKRPGKLLLEKLGYVRTREYRPVGEPSDEGEYNSMAAVKYD